VQQAAAVAAPGGNRLNLTEAGPLASRFVSGPAFVHRERVRFRDLDAMGHVNNAVFLTYIESARVAFLQQLGAVSLESMPIIVARIEIDFRAPVSLGEEVEISVRATRFGEKSFDLGYVLRVDGHVVAEAKSVLVGYDYGTGQTIAIPDGWRERMAA